MPRNSGATVLTNVLVLQDDRFAKEEIGGAVAYDLMESGLVEELIEGRDRPDVLMIILKRNSSKDAILTTIRNTMDRLGV